ncbi:hypothetical protein R1sor_027318 [Riccia sorocarpa]|uniref:Uncharacterized protein n=1 Tax=Riccia sorocarpa TaxID=122646 RepID=A0ABD3GDW7_9MARC
MPPAPRRPRLDAARLPVTCHCVKCKGMMTRTTIEAERHIQQWGHHDEGESSRVASDRGREVHTRSRLVVRDILRRGFIQFSMSAIQDFTTLLRTNRARTPMPPPVDSEVFRRALETLDISALFTPPTSIPASSAVPPPDLGMDVQPEPKVEPEIQPPEVQPEVHDQPEVQPEIQHTVEPIASVESHHPSAEVHAVAGESILVVERYVAEDQDDDTSGHAGIVPEFEMYPRRLREAIETGGMLRYESDPNPPVVEEDVISSEDEIVGGLQDEEEAMADLFTEWFPPEPPTGNTLLLINFVQSS